MENKYTWKKIYLGLKKAFLLPKLPPLVLKYYNSTIVKVVRVVGGICFLLFISKISTSFPLNIHWCINIVGIIHIIHMLIITIIKTVYVFYILKYKPEYLHVYNSPLDKASSSVARLALCGLFGILGSFSCMLLFVKFGMLFLPMNAIALIIWCAMVSALTSYWYDGYILSKNGFVKGFQIISLCVILSILIFCVSSELGLLDYILCEGTDGDVNNNNNNSSSSSSNNNGNNDNNDGHINVKI